MSSIIIAFPVSRGNFSIKVRDTLTSYGFDDVTIVASASEALQEMHLRKNGILISCVKLPDMYYRELIQYLPDNFRLLLLDTEYNIGSLRESDIVALTVPISTRDLINTVRTMDAAYGHKEKSKKGKPRKTRSEKEEKIIAEAKSALMNRNHLTEPEAYRFIQKTSMDTGRTLVETAQMIILFADRSD